MTSAQKTLIMADPIAAGKAAVVRELRRSITSDAIAGNASASISAAGGSKSWGKMSLSERRAWLDWMEKDLNNYIRSRYGITTTSRPDIRHVRTVRCF